MGIGAHDQAFIGGGRRQHRAIVAAGQPFVVQGAGEQLVDQLGHGPAAAPVGHLHLAVLQIQRPYVPAPHCLRIGAHEASATGRAPLNCP
jgi:hypothetical protein